VFSGQTTQQQGASLMRLIIAEMGRHTVAHEKRKILMNN
jgi:hypothetical protein